jgi:hypothetical protein
MIQLLCELSRGLAGIHGSQNEGYEEFCHVEYNTLLSVESQRKFRRNMSPPFSDSKNKPN